MENPLTLKDELIFKAIQEGYGIKIASLNFLLRGWGGDCFAAETQDNIRYFLKFHDETGFTALAASSRTFYLPLMYQLHNKGILPNIHHPIPTIEGELTLKIAPYDLVITNFIEGDLVGFGELPNDILIPLAQLVGILHHSKPQLEFQHPFIDEFEIGYEDLLLKLLEKVDRVPTQNRPGQQKLKEIVIPLKDRILKSLKRHKELRVYTQNSNKATVICHTDLHGANLMTDQNGNLFILDWENAILAPPEHDLFFFVEDDRFWDLFFPAYIEKQGTVDLDVKIFEFYFLRRAFEDITDFILRIMNGDGSEERDLSDLNYLTGNLKWLQDIQKNVIQLQEKISLFS